MKRMRGADGSPHFFKKISLSCSNSPSRKVFRAEGCDHLPDAAEAVSRYGPTVYRLAYAQTRRQIPCRHPPLLLREVRHGGDRTAPGAKTRHRTEPADPGSCLLPSYTLRGDFYTYGQHTDNRWPEVTFPPENT